MRIYMKKRHIKKVLVAIAVAVMVLALLAVVSWWDNKQGTVDTDTIQPTAPPTQEQVMPPEVSDPAPPGEENTIQSPRPDQPVSTQQDRPADALIAEVYALQDTYVTALENMYAEAETALTNLAKQENNAEAMAQLASSYLNKASELEAQCDEQIDAIVAELQTLVRDGNEDPAIIDTLVETYANEKATKKAWYIQRLEEKGLIS